MSKQGDCFSGWRLTFSSSSVELLLVGRENLPRHVVHSTSVTCKGLFLAAKDYLFSCRECHIAYSKWKSYCLYLLAAWQAQVPHNLGWEEEGSSSSLARKTEKNSQDSPASGGMLKECLCSGWCLCFQASPVSLSFQPLLCLFPCMGTRKRKRSVFIALAVAAGLTTSEEWLARCERPVRHLAGLLFGLWIILCRSCILPCHMTFWAAFQDKWINRNNNNSLALFSQLQDFGNPQHTFILGLQFWKCLE